MSRDMQDSTIGSHVERSPQAGRNSAAPARQSGVRPARRPTHGQVDTLAGVGMGDGQATRQHVGQRQYIDTMQRRARKRRIGVGVVIAIAVIALAAIVGFLVFRGSIGSELALRDSDASQALVSVHSDEPYYALVAADLGAVAKPLDHEGPDVLLLVRVDRENKSLGMVVIPAGLQVATDSGARRVGDLAANGDAALIQSVSSFAKVDISHYVKIGKDGLAAIIDALGGIDINIDQVIDDPQAGDVYLPMGQYTLNGSSALTYLRAQNLKLGVADQLDHQALFATLLFEKLFSGEGNFTTRLEQIDSYFQTDLSLGDIEALQSWISEIPSGGMACTVLPGYLTEVTGVVETGDALYIASADDMASIIAALESNSVPDVSSKKEIQPADPSSFTVEVQNGTEMAGAASITGDTLKAAGFNVEKVGNAEQQIYNETLIVYRGAEGPSRAQAVINTLGIGRAIDGEIYYKMSTDVLVIIGGDYKPFV